MVQAASDRSFSGKVAGFTLVEMMIALVILSVAILGLSMAVLTAIQTNQGNDVRNAAVRLASEKAEEILSMPIDSIASAEDSPAVTTRGGGSVSFSRTWTVSTPTNDIKQVEITVSYIDNKGVSRSASTLVYKHRAT